MKLGEACQESLSEVKGLHNPPFPPRSPEALHLQPAKTPRQSPELFLGESSSKRHGAAFLTAGLAWLAETGSRARMKRGKPVNPMNPKNPINSKKTHKPQNIQTLKSFDPIHPMAPINPIKPVNPINLINLKNPINPTGGSQGHARSRA